MYCTLQLGMTLRLHFTASEDFTYKLHFMHIVLVLVYIELWSVLYQTAGHALVRLYNVQCTALQLKNLPVCFYYTERLSLSLSFNLLLNMELDLQSLLGLYLGLLRVDLS